MEAEAETETETETVYTLSQVAQNDGRNGNRLWIIYKDYVLDVTDFIQEVITPNSPLFYHS